MMAVVKFDRAREKRRAKFAYNLYKFRDHLGRKLPQNEAGITEHREAVARYVNEYGPVKTDYEKVYLYIRKGITNESKRQSDNAALRKKLIAAKEAEDKQRIENNKKIRVEQQHDKDITAAKHIVSTYPRRIASYEKRLKQARRRRDQFQKTVDDLTPKLKTEEYKKLRAYRSYVKKCEKCAYWVIRFTKIIHKLETRVIPLRNALATARTTLYLGKLGAEINANVIKVVKSLQTVNLVTTNDDWLRTVKKETAKLKSNTPKSKRRWAPVWSKSKYDKYRELQNIPAVWDVRKVVLIWYGDHMEPELRVFGKVTSHAVNGLLGPNTILPIIKTTRAKIDYQLTRKQYDQVSI